MIKLSVVSYNNEAAPPLSAMFDGQGRTLGRDKDNHLVLSDPKRMVSRKQAALKSDGLRHTIVNLSQANPILVNGQEIGFGQEFALRKDDEIRIGLYVLCVTPQAGFAAAEMPAVGPTTGTSNAVSVPESLSNAQHGVPAGEPASEPDNLTATSEKTVTIESAATPQAPSANTSPTSSVEPAPADSQALIDAFMSGAGISHISLGGGLTPELMETIGKLLATTIEGTFDLVASRAVIKREVKAEVTTVVVRNNNPLKFLPDGESVLIQMLRKKMPGFMAPAEAMQDAYKDLHAHQSGMTAGVRAAMDDVLERCSPRLLDQLQSRTALDAIAPMYRKAKLWDAYVAAHAALRKKSRNEDQAPFGKAFLTAYEEAIERFENETRDG